MDPGIEGPSPTTTRTLAIACAIAVLAAIALSARLASSRGAWGTLEGESAEHSREILRRGEWLKIYRNREEFNQKPPFAYGLMALAAKVGGAVTPFSARVPSLAGALAVSGLFFVLARRSGTAGGVAVPLLASAIFLSTVKVFWMSQMARVDMLFLACVSAAVVAAASALEADPTSRARRLGPWAFHAASLAASLVKGPLGAVICFGSLGLYLAVARRFADLRRFFLSPALAVSVLGTTALYALVVSRTEGRFFREFFLVENLARFAGPLDLKVGDVFYRQPSWQYPAYFAAGFLPWTVLLIPAAVRFWTERHRLGSVEKLLLAHAGFVLVFFSLAGVKRSDYILPMYPAMAFLLARDLVERASSSRLWVLRRAIALAAILGAVGLLVFLAIAPSLDPASVSVWRARAWCRKWPELAGDTAVFVLGSVGERAIPGAAILLAVGAMLMVPLRGAFAGLRSFLFAAVGSLSFATLVVVPIQDAGKDVRPFAARTAAIAGEAPIAFVGTWLEDVAFFLDRRVPRIESDQFVRALDPGSPLPPRSFYILREREYRELEVEIEEHGTILLGGEPPIDRLYLVTRRDTGH